VEVSSGPNNSAGAHARAPGAAIAHQLQDPDSLLLDALDPEQALVRKKYSPLFQTALREAIQQLSRRDRTLLRFRYIAGMSYDAMARTYHVGRATVVCWIGAIRDELDGAVRIRLWKELGVSPSEFRSLWQAVRSEVEVSLSRLLAGKAQSTSSR
jgi:RNA polymerase sigma-70 factor